MVGSVVSLSRGGVRHRICGDFSGFSRLVLFRFFYRSLHFVSYSYTSLITPIHHVSAGRPGKSQQTRSSAAFALSNNKEKTIDLSLLFLFTITIVLHRRHLIVLPLEPESAFPVTAYINHALASLRGVSRMPLFPSSFSPPTPSIKTTDPR
jgi:hypothetical protein